MKKQLYARLHRATIGWLILRRSCQIPLFWHDHGDSMRSEAAWMYKLAEDRHGAVGCLRHYHC